jgi:hypothetical protein
MLSVIYAECRYVECRYAECRGALSQRMMSQVFYHCATPLLAGILQ